MIVRDAGVLAAASGRGVEEEAAGIAAEARGRALLERVHPHKPAGLARERLRGVVDEDVDAREALLQQAARNHTSPAAPAARARVHAGRGRGF